MRKVFLRLNEINGRTPNAGHLGEIEIASFLWGGNNRSPRTRSNSALKNVTIIKRADRATNDLRVAALTGQRFTGQLTLEDFSASGSLLRSIVFELEAAFVDSVTDIEGGEIINLSCRRIKLADSSKENFENRKVVERELGEKSKYMRRNLVIISIILVVLAFGIKSASAQFNIKFPDIKVKKPEIDTTKNKDSDTNGKTNNVKTNNNLTYPLVLPTNVPVFMKNSLQIATVVHDEYWKMKGQSNYSSWIPKLRFDQFYNGEKSLNYTVEYFNPDGSLWFSEKLESSGGYAERTVLYQSPSLSDNFDTKSTDGTGVYGFKITSDDTKQVLFQGKFKVGKFSRAYRPDEKNKCDFYIDYDWVLPFAQFGFHHAIDGGGALRPELGVWLKGAVESDELEGRVFYKGQQIASTRDAEGGGVGVVEERLSGFAAAFEQGDKMWKRWQFTWNNFRVDGNGSFNPEDFRSAHFADKNPGEYTIKIYRNGAQIREIALAVGADGKFVTPGYSNQIPLPYYRFILPVKIVGTNEKFDAAAWKTGAFYGNPLNGFAVQ